MVSVIAVIGAGQLGSRHLQALANLKDNTQIYVIDPSAVSLSTAQSRYEQVRGSASLPIFSSDLRTLPALIDVAIVATNSGPRRKAIEAILKNRTVRHLVLEKVLFPNVDDYKWATKLANQSAFVNCPQRSMAWAKKLRTELGGANSLHIHVSGASLGLGCNSIHYIDLFNFLTNKTTYTISTAGLESEIERSKRPGYYEAYGTLLFQFDGDHSLSLRSLRDSTTTTTLEFLTEISRHLMIYTQGQAGIMITANASTDWQLRQEPFALEYQSELSHLFVTDLLSTSSCALTPLQTSIDLHEPFIQGLADFFATKETEGEFDCPIS